MKKYYRITKQIGFSYLSMILVFLFSPLSIYLLTRYLTIEQFGAYSIISITVEIAIVVLELGLTEYIVTTLSGMTQKRKAEAFFSLVIFEILLFGVLSILFLTPLQIHIISLLKLGQYVIEFRIGLVIIFFGLLIRLYSSYYAANKKLEFQSLIASLLKSLWIIFVIIYTLVFRKLSLVIVMLLWISGVFLTFLLCFFNSKKEIVTFIRAKNINFSIIRKAIMFSSPLLFYYTGTYTVALADRYMLTYYTTLTLVGIYTLAYSICTLILSLGVTTSDIIYPYIAEAWNNKKDHNLFFNASFKYNLMIVLPAAAGVFVLKEQLVTLISGVSYLNSAKVIPILIFYPIISSIMYMLYQNMLLRRKTKQIAVIYVLGGVINIILNLLLIPKYNIYGAAIATIISYVFMFFVMYALCYKHIEINLKFMKIEKMVFASLLMGVLIYFIGPTIVWTKLIAIAAGAICYFSLLFLFRFFSKEELAIIQFFLRKTLLKKE